MLNTFNSISFALIILSNLSFYSVFSLFNMILFCVNINFMKKLKSTQNNIILNNEKTE
jgi:hypothetical protein